MGVVCKHMHSLGWSWEDFDYIDFGGRGRLPLLSGPSTWWKNTLREGLCCTLWAEAATRRNDMQGLEAKQGLDRRATMALSGQTLAPDEVGLLRSVLVHTMRMHA